MTTKAGYNTVQKFLDKNEFGSRKIGTIRTSDAKLFLIKLQQEGGKSYSSIHTIRGVLRPAFQLAVDDDILVKNPFDFQLVNVLINDSVTREAITKVLFVTLPTPNYPKIFQIKRRCSIIHSDE